MQKFMKSGLMAVVLAGLFLVGCDDNEALIPVEGDTYDAEMTIEEGLTATKTVFVTDLIDATEITVKTTFTSSDKKMRRVYMTENIAGSGTDIFELTLSGLDKKSDNSLDVSNKTGKEFEYVLTFPVYELEAGTVVYQIWTTDGRGDYRDPSKNEVSKVGTLTINYGGTNPATELRESEVTILAAPKADGTSETFISMIDGEIYKISDGEEFAAFWDFGYYYGATKFASFASTNDYPSLFDHDNNDATALVSVDVLTGTPKAELNTCYFAHSEIDFDAASIRSDLDGITKSSSQRINELAVGDVVEFVDNYGKKGLIKVTALETGFTGKITILIKVQP